MNSISDSGTSLRPDPDQMRAMLSAITVPGKPFEIGVIKCRKTTPDGLKPDPYTKAMSGFFTEVETAVSHAERFAGDDCAGVHVTVNALADHVLNWGSNRIAKGNATAKADVVGYRHLFVDVDPHRPSDTNATERERTAARDRAKQVLTYLRDLGWPNPVWGGSSGSGFSILFRIDLEPSDEPLVKRVLQGLNELFGDEAVGIDTSTGDPQRLVRLAGTVNAKAITPTPERPWRLATGKAGSKPGCVSREQLASVAALEREPVRVAPYTGNKPKYDLPAILSDSAIQYREKQVNYGTVYEIANCLTSANHADGACFIQLISGAPVYRCLHNSCRDKRWQDVKPLLKLPERSTDLISRGNGFADNASNNHGQPTAFRLRTRKASTIEARDIDWIWKPWLPAGMLGLLAGYGGSGKSTLALSIAAACSVGGTLADGQRAPLLNTLIFAAEDSPEHTIIPRLHAMDANLECIRIVDGISRDGEDPGWVQLRNHAAVIEQDVIDRGIGLVLIDPVSSYIGDANSDKESDVRSGVTPLIRMAERTRAAVLMIRHVSKAGDGTRAASRILGSTAWHDIPRVVWMLADAPDEHQPEPHEDGTRDTRRVLGVVKTNFVRPQARWGIQPVDGPLRWLPDASPVTIDECFSSQSNRGSRSRDAEEWLRERLAGGSQPTRTVESAAKDAGISTAALRRARASLNVKPRKERTGEWVITLPPRPVESKWEGVQSETKSGYVQELNALPALLESKAFTPNTLNTLPENLGIRVGRCDTDTDTEEPEKSKAFNSTVYSPDERLRTAEPLEPTGTDINGAHPGEIPL